MSFAAMYLMSVAETENSFSVLILFPPLGFGVSFLWCCYLERVVLYRSFSFCSIVHCYYTGAPLAQWQGQGMHSVISQLNLLVGLHIEAVTSQVFPTLFHLYYILPAAHSLFWLQCPQSISLKLCSLLMTFSLS